MKALNAIRNVGLAVIGCGALALALFSADIASAAAPSLPKRIERGEPKYPAKRFRGTKKPRNITIQVDRDKAPRNLDTFNRHTIGFVQVGGYRDFSISISGSSPRTWGPSTFSGGSGMSLVEDTCANTVQPANVSCRFTVRFQPGAAYRAQATLVQSYYGGINNQQLFYDNRLYLGRSTPFNPKLKCQECGSVIDIDSGVLSEEVPLTGVDFSLFYTTRYSSNFQTEEQKGNNPFFSEGGFTLTNQHYYDSQAKKIFTGGGVVQPAENVVLPGGNLRVVSLDGKEVYIFRSDGAHLQTLSAFTGAVIRIFAYDSGQHLTSITDAFGNATTLPRDGAGKATAIVSPYGVTTTLTYDSNGLLSAVQNPASETYSFAYKPGTSIMNSFTRPDGGVSQFSYSSTNQLLQDASPADTSWNFSNLYPGDGSQVVQKQSRNGVFTQYKMYDGYQGEFRRTEVTPFGMSIDSVQNPDDSKVTTKPYIETTELTTADERFGNAFLRAASTKSVTAAGTEKVEFGQSVSFSGNGSDPFAFSSLTKTATVLSASGNRTSTSSFDNGTKTITTTSPEGRVITTVLNANEQEISLQVGSDLPILSNYDNRGRLVSKTQGTRTLVSYTYDANGRVESRKNGRNETTSFAYDGSGRLTQETFADLRKVLYGYNANGDRTSVTTPSGALHGFQYDPKGKLTRYLPPAVPGLTNKDTAYSYNFDGKLGIETRPDFSSVGNNYDSAGRRYAYTDGTRTAFEFYKYQTDLLENVSSLDGSSYFYDYLGDKLSVETSYSTDANYNFVLHGGLSYGYDDSGRRNKIEIYDGAPAKVATSNITYNKDDQITQVGDMALTYDPASGRLLTTTLGKVSDLRTYNSFGELSGYTATFTPDVGAAQVLYSYSLVRDAGGRICGKTETVLGVTDTYEYGFDLVGRLTRVTKNGSPYSLYTYDANGNRTAGNVGGVAFTASFDAQDRLIQQSGADYSYNPNGELTGINGSGIAKSFSYNVLGQLTGASDGTASVSYALDSYGRRIQRLVSGAVDKKFIYLDDLRIAAETSAAGDLIQSYFYATGSTAPDYSEKGAGQYFFVKDHLGSPRLIVKASDGAVAQRLDYDEFGKILFASAPGFQSYGFAGGIPDALTGLVKFGAREYNPDSGRWITKDPIRFHGGDPSLYVYAMNDPLNRVDSRGFRSALAAGGGGFATFGECMKSTLNSLPICTETAKFTQQAEVYIGVGCSAVGVSVGFFGTPAAGAAAGYACGAKCEAVLGAVVAGPAIGCTVDANIACEGLPFY